MGPLACQPGGGPAAGEYRLQGEGALGTLRIPTGGCGGGEPIIELFAPGLRTEGPVGARLETEAEGVHWLRFPARSALGPSLVSLRWQGREGRLPLGAREGEHELRLAVEPGALEPELLEEARQEAEQRLQAQAEAWSRGAFLLLDDEKRLVGELLLQPDQPPRVAVYDTFWWTEGAVLADRVDEGPDILLAFPVEPSVRGEEGLLRLNVPFSDAIVPADRLPTPMDRRLRLRPGLPEASAREQARQEALARSLAEEEQAMLSLGKRLASWAQDEGGGCRGEVLSDPSVADLLVGYQVAVEADPRDGCRVHFQPAPVQHRRRLERRVGRGGFLLQDPTATPWVDPP